MVYLLHFLPQLLDQPVGVSFGIIFPRAHRIGDVMLVVSDKPHSIASSEFFPFVDFGSEGFDFGGHLDGDRVLLYRHR